MTARKHLKALVRARMARTGESYTAARRHLLPSGTRSSLTLATEFRAHERHCMTAVFAPGDRQLLSGGFSGEVRLWDLSGAMLGELVGHSSSVNAICLSDDGRTAVTASSDRTVRLWDVPGRLARAVLGRHRRQVTALALDEARGRAWSGGHDGRLRAWDLATGEPGLSVDVGLPITSLAVRRSDGALAVATLGAGLSVRDPEGEAVVRLGEDRPVVTGAAWSADGAVILASHPAIERVRGSVDAQAGGAILWSADDWEPLRSLPGGPGMLPMALSPDGGWLVLGWDHHVGLWGPADEKPAAVLGGLPKGIYGVRFSGDGARLAVAAADGRVRVLAVS